MPVGFAALLAISHQNYGRSEIASIAYEAAGVPDGTRGVGKHLKVIIGTQVGQHSQPVRLLLVTEHADGLTDVISTRINVGPEQNAWHLQR